MPTRVTSRLQGRLDSSSDSLDRNLVHASSSEVVGSQQRQAVPVAAASAAASFDVVAQEEELKDVALAVIANKQDLPRALNEGEISMALGLPTLRDRRWSVFSASAVKGEGLSAAMDWLADVLS
ncbi:ADP-ribosylation factor domain-containing protein, putative [Eimeria necatrix]|uniref:ADP-ribosylation factor domain-containing protein, putative n=1 Tax=Eimeria necatrix TaxID=51315 RepID=U6MPK2_9EIME|nr:ADP-ribosylation factor domain-containing protein, putative [Eimeria necatrix]CDJ64419.1 ADP-ribosylation factor domain-containing protein, putative [Eimeria necatrix]